MTRGFNQKTFCPKCNSWHDAETAFNRWLRAHPDLDSVRNGIMRFDCDLLLHRYKLDLQDVSGSREIQCIMFVEVKTNGAQLTISQQDTLSLFSQVLRNRKPNIHSQKKGRHLGDHTPLASAYSHCLKRNVRLRMFGGHLLRMSANDPTDSEWMEWDHHRIGVADLVRLLNFDTDPDSWPLRPMDWRRRYRAAANTPRGLFDKLRDG